MRKFRSRDVETVHVFSGTYVVHRISPDEVGVFRTQNIEALYSVAKLGDSRCIVVLDTNSKYPLRLFRRDINAIAEAIRLTADGRQLKAVQIHSKPDYGFEVLPGRITSEAIKGIGIRGMQEGRRTGQRRLFRIRSSR